MKASSWITLGGAMLASVGPLQANTSDIGLDTRITPFEAYVDASQDTILRLEPLFIAYQEATNVEDTKQAAALLHRIVLLNTLEDWRWKFYQHGLHHPEEMGSRERAAWEYVRETVGGRTVPPDPEEMLKMSPDHIRNSLMREKRDIEDILKNFGNPPDAQKPLSDMDGRTRATKKRVQHNEHVQQPVSSTNGATQTSFSSRAFLATMAIIGAVAVRIVFYVLRRRHS